MKNILMTLFLLPILIFANYPIYENDFEEQFVPESSHAATQEKLESGIQEESASSQSFIKKHDLRDQTRRLRQNTAKSEEKNEVESSENKRSAVAQRNLIKRNSASAKTGDQSKSKLRNARHNPNRPRVMHRENQKQPIPPSSLEADAEKVEGMTAHPKEEAGTMAQEKEVFPSQQVEVEKKVLNQKECRRQDSERPSHPGKRSFEY